MKSLYLILTQKRYLAPAMVFASVNILFGTWAIYIATVKEKLGLDNSQIGTAIFFLALGVFTMFPLSPKIIAKIGVGKTTWYSLLICASTAILPFMAGDFITLCAALYIFGLFNGMADIAMNTLVAEIEKEDKVMVMSSTHGFFSLGGILVGGTAFLIPILDRPWLHMLIMVLLVLAINIILKGQYENIKADSSKNDGKFRFIGSLMILAMVCFMSMSSEGAIVDWSGLYLKEVLKAPEHLWGMGFLAFSVAMTTGRFFGDGISEKLGSLKVLAIGAIVASLGYVAVLNGGIFISIAGFAFCGLGLSILVPELYRIGGSQENVDPANGVAFVAGVGYIGFLLGPVLLGFLSEAFDLSIVFKVLLASSLLILITSLTLGSKKK